MTTTFEGIPSELAAADLGPSSVSLSVDAGIYPLEALYGAAYIFIDRCYVFIDRPEASRYRVILTAKKPVSDAGVLKALVGEFSNELLACAWRHQIAQENRSIIEAVTTQAIAGAMGPPSLDELASFDFAEEAFEDPLGIAMSWEDKYKKKDKAEGASDSSSSPAQGTSGEGKSL